jgi:hypothetical protein
MNKTYVYKKDKQMGPFDDKTILYYLKCSILDYSDLCWREGWNDWKSLDSVYLKPITKINIKEIILGYRQDKIIISILIIFFIILSLFIIVNGCKNKILDDLIERNNECYNKWSQEATKMEAKIFEIKAGSIYEKYNYLKKFSELNDIAETRIKSEKKHLKSLELDDKDIFKRILSFDLFGFFMKEQIDIQITRIEMAENCLLRQKNSCKEIESIPNSTLAY